MKRIKQSQTLSSEYASVLRDMLANESFSNVLDYMAMEARYYRVEEDNPGFMDIANIIEEAKRKVWDIEGEMVEGV